MDLIRFDIGMLLDLFAPSHFIILTLGRDIIPVVLASLILSLARYGSPDPISLFVAASILGVDILSRRFGHLG